VEADMQLEQIADIINAVTENGKISLDESTALGNLPVMVIPDFVQNEEHVKWKTFIETTDEEVRKNFKSKLPEKSMLVYTNNYPDVVCKLELTKEVYNVKMTVYFEGRFYVAKCIEGGWAKTGKWIDIPLLSTKPVDHIPVEVSKLLDSLLTYAGVLKLFGFNSIPKPRSVNPTPKVKDGKISPESLVSIVYLDKPIKDNKDPDGAVRIPHEFKGRRRHTRTLKHPRYRHHPMYLVPNGVEVGESVPEDLSFVHKKVVYTLRGTYG